MIITASTQQDRILYIDFKAKALQKENLTQELFVSQTVPASKDHPLGTGAAPQWSLLHPTLQEVTVPLLTILL